jgi:hypothetical protein
LLPSFFGSADTPFFCQDVRRRHPGIERSIRLRFSVDWEGKRTPLINRALILDNTPPDSIPVQKIGEESNIVQDEGKSFATPANEKKCQE